MHWLHALLVDVVDVDLHLAQCADAAMRGVRETVRSTGRSRGRASSQEKLALSERLPAPSAHACLRMIAPFWPVSKRVNSSRAPDDDRTLIELIAARR
jgi:hypothetical protein